jgi:hypothetical protein
MDVQVFIIAIVQIVATAALGYWLNGRLSRFNTELRNQEMRFSYMHKSRAEAIDELYKKMDRTYRTWASATSMLRTNLQATIEQDQTDGTRLVIEFFDYYFQNRLYLDGTLIAEIDKLNEKWKAVVIHTGSASNLSAYAFAGDASISQQRTEFLTQASQIVASDIPPILKRIEVQMRETLGVTQK